MRWEFSRSRVFRESRPTWSYNKRIARAEQKDVQANSFIFITGFSFFLFWSRTYRLLQYITGMEVDPEEPQTTCVRSPQSDRSNATKGEVKNRFLLRSIETSRLKIPKLTFGSPFKHSDVSGIIPHRCLLIYTFSKTELKRFEPAMLAVRQFSKLSAYDIL